MKPKYQIERGSMRTSFLCAFALVFTACAAEPVDTEAVDDSELVAEAAQAITETATATRKVDSDWGAGYCVKYQIKNTGAYETNSWTLKLNMNGTNIDMNNKWNGTFSVSGSTLTITPSSTNGKIAAGATLSYDQGPGFCASRPSGGSALPTVQSMTGDYCGTVYRDADGDSFGNASDSQYTCTNPTGYVTNSRDKCDSDNRVKPGVTTYYSTANNCGTYDYNSDGVETKQSNGPTGCFETPMQCVAQGTTCVAVPVGTLPAACNGKFTSYDTAACGATWYISTKGCVKTSIGTCISFGNGGPGGTQACR